jgi:hypothetical protein
MDPILLKDRASGHAVSINSARGDAPSADRTSISRVPTDSGWRVSGQGKLSIAVDLIPDRLAEDTEEQTASQICSRLEDASRAGFSDEVTSVAVAWRENWLSDQRL